MRRLPLADQLPYRFHPPRLSPLVVRLTRGWRGSMLRKDHAVAEVDFQGLEIVEKLLGRGDGVLFAPNHSDHADALVMFALADRLRSPFCYMAAYQIFEGNAGLRHQLFPRLGVFPVDREGADLKAFKAGVEVLSKAKHPLVIFPEGEIYYLADRITPLRDGASAVAATAGKKLVEGGRKTWIVPVGIKYRFLGGHDPLPGLSDLMSDLERRYTWRPHDDWPIVDRIYHFAEATLHLMEFEHLGACQSGPLKPRLATLRDRILDAIEDRLLKARRSETVPVRVKELRRHCLEILSDPATTAEQAGQIRRDLHDLFRVVQLFSYPGDYIREAPTVERVAEVLTKLEEDSLGRDDAIPRAPRRAEVRLGEPIAVHDRLGRGAKPRTIIPGLTADLEHAIQGLLDRIGPGRPLPGRPEIPRGQESAKASSSGS